MRCFMTTLLVLVFVFVAAMDATAQTRSNFSPQTSSRPYYRTIVTYNGQVCLATEHYDIMGSGKVVFKQNGLRFTDRGYVWSPAVPDRVVRQGHYASRIVGTQKSYWPPLVQPSPTTATLPFPISTISKSWQSRSRVPVTPRPSITHAVPSWKLVAREQGNSDSLDPMQWKDIQALKPSAYLGSRYVPRYCTPRSVLPECQSPPSLR